MCRSCGEKIECENCAISMTYHKKVSESDAVAQPGSGWNVTIAVTEGRCRRRVRNARASIFIFLERGRSRRGEVAGTVSFGAIGRMDRDTVRGRTDMERLLARLHGGEINLLVGTQMIAKDMIFTGSRWWGGGADFQLGCRTFARRSGCFSC